MMEPSVSMDGETLHGPSVNTESDPSRTNEPDGWGDWAHNAVEWVNTVRSKVLSPETVTAVSMAGMTLMNPNVLGAKQQSFEAQKAPDHQIEKILTDSSSGQAMTLSVGGENILSLNINEALDRGESPDPRIRTYELSDTLRLRLGVNGKADFRRSHPEGDDIEFYKRKTMGDLSVQLYEDYSGNNSDELIDMAGECNSGALKYLETARDRTQSGEFYLDNDGRVVAAIGSPQPEGRIGTFPDPDERFKEYRNNNYSDDEVGVIETYDGVDMPVQNITSNMNTVTLVDELAPHPRNEHSYYVRASLHDFMDENDWERLFDAPAVDLKKSDRFYPVFSIDDNEKKLTAILDGEKDQIITDDPGRAFELGENVDEVIFRSAEIDLQRNSDHEATMDFGMD